MNKLKNIVRENIQQLSPYSSARDKNNIKKGILLDANENPYGSLNRYPDPYQNKLKQLLSDYKKVAKETIFIGNGSDQVIDLAFRIFCNPIIDQALTFSPTYGMYQVTADINNVKLVNIPLKWNFQINREKTAPYLKDNSYKLLLICSPNNPTGNCINHKDILFILKNFKGAVLIDEAYIDFSDYESSIKLINSFPNLIVSQTLSKAWALAGARIGIAYSSPYVISLFNKIKPPYNVSELNQKAACTALANKELFLKKKKQILSEKEKLAFELNKISCVTKVFPSQANFLLVKFSSPIRVFQELLNNGIIIRKRTNQVPGCLRITIGTPNENQQLINVLKQIK